jgi:hypothetical protein
MSKGTVGLPSLLAGLIISTTKETGYTCMKFGVVSSVLQPHFESRSRCGKGMPLPITAIFSRPG